MSALLTHSEAFALEALENPKKTVSSLLIIVGESLQITAVNYRVCFTGNTTSVSCIDI